MKGVSGQSQRARQEGEEGAEKRRGGRTFFFITTWLLKSFSPLAVTCRSTVLWLARPECLKECTLSRLPGSDENWTAPSRLVFPRLCRKLLLLRTSCQIRLSEAILIRVWRS